MLVCGAMQNSSSFMLFALISFSILSVEVFLIFFTKIFLPIPVKSIGVFFFSDFSFSADNLCLNLFFFV